MRAGLHRDKRLPEHLGGVLHRQQARLLSQFFVGLFQLLLLALQLLCEGLRLFEQPFGAHVGLDRVQHDAHAFSQLLKKILVRGAETFKGSQFHHGLHLALENHRQHHDVERGGLSQAGADLDIIGRDVVEQGALLFNCALPHQALAGHPLMLLAVRLAPAVSRQ